MTAQMSHDNTENNQSAMTYKTTDVLNIHPNTRITMMETKTLKTSIKLLYLRNMNNY